MRDPLQHALSLRRSKTHFRSLTGVGGPFVSPVNFNFPQHPHNMWRTYFFDQLINDCWIGE